MTITEARQELAELILQDKSIRHRKKKLKSFITSRGAVIDLEVKKIIRRNTAIYLRWVLGESFTAIAPRFGLTPARIGDICHRVEVYVAKKKTGYAKLPKKIA